MKQQTIRENTKGTEVLAGVRAVTRAATTGIADEVITPFRAWPVHIYLCALHVCLLDFRVDSAAVPLCEGRCERARQQEAFGRGN